MRVDNLESAALEALAVNRGHVHAPRAAGSRRPANRPAEVQRACRAALTTPRRGWQGRNSAASTRRAFRSGSLTLLGELTEALRVHHCDRARGSDSRRRSRRARRRATTRRPPAAWRRRQCRSPAGPARSRRRGNHRAMHPARGVVQQDEAARAELGVALQVARTNICCERQRMRGQTLG